MQKQNVILQTNGKVQPENVTHIKETDRQTDRQADRQTDILRYIQTDRQRKVETKKIFNHPFYGLKEWDSFGLLVFVPKSFFLFFVRKIQPLFFL